MRLEIYLAHLLSIQKDLRKDPPEVFPALYLPGKEHLRITLLGLRRALSPYLKRYFAEICCAAALKMALSPAAPRCSPHLKALCRSGIIPRAFPPENTSANTAAECPFRKNRRQVCPKPILVFHFGRAASIEFPKNRDFSD